MIDKKIMESIPDNFFVFAMLRQDEVIPQPALTPKLIKAIAEFINKNTYNSVVLIIRNEDEPIFKVRKAESNGYPPSELVTQLKNQINITTHLFYQNPWPEPVPNFDDSDKMYIQLGFDEGNLFHKSEKIKHNGQEYVFLPNKEIFTLNNPYKNELL